jgi:hypothetical protein
MRSIVAAAGIFLAVAAPASASTASQLRLAQHDIRILRQQVTALSDAVSRLSFQSEKRDAALTAATAFADCHQRSIPVGRWGSSASGYVYGILGVSLFQTSALDVVVNTTGLTAGQDYVWLNVTDGACMGTSAPAGLRPMERVR